MIRLDHEPGGVGADALVLHDRQLDCGDALGATALADELARGAFGGVPDTLVHLAEVLDTPFTSLKRVWLCARRSRDSDMSSRSSRTTRERRPLSAARPDRRGGGVEAPKGRRTRYGEGTTARPRTPGDEGGRVLVTPFYPPCLEDFPDKDGLRVPSPRFVPSKIPVVASRIAPASRLRYACCTASSGCLSATSAAPNPRGLPCPRLLPRLLQEALTIILIRV